jgi:hypothetical protein
MRLTKTEVAEFSAVLGSAPVLTSESDRDYNEIWENLIVTFAPRDFMELLLIRQVQNETWKILRYTRHQTLGIDRRFRESLELQTRAQKEQAARRGALAKELAKQTGRSETELGASAISARNRDVVRRRCRRDIKPRADRDRA